MLRKVAALAAVLASCSDAPVPRRPRTVVALGDSITQGVQPELPAIRTPYPATLQRMLGDGWTVENLGVSGYRARDVRRRWKQARPRGFSTAIVLVGANDLRLGTPAAEVWEDLEPTYEEILADGMQLVTVTVTPLRGWRLNPWTRERQAELEGINARIASFCEMRGCAVVDAYGAFVDPAVPHALRREWDYGDHLHLSQAGLDRLAALARAALP